VEGDGGTGDGAAGRQGGRKGMGGVREAGEKGVESGIKKVTGSGRKRGNYTTLRNIL